MADPYSSENHSRRYGTHCKQCRIELGEHRLDGTVNGVSVAFCSFKCHDVYVDEQAAFTSKTDMEISYPKAKDDPE